MVTMPRSPVWRCRPIHWILTVSLVGYQLFPFMSVSGDVTRSSYRAAVYEHMVIIPFKTQKAVPRADAVRLMKMNLAIYEKQSKLAGKQKADILVFPEDGIYGPVFSRDGIYPYLEIIPDPVNVTWSPCSDPSRFPDTEVQHSLSCMAAKNRMYIVANMGDKVNCHKETDPKCPPDGRYQYNTVVAYDPEGTLVGKYHKRHLFYEEQFDQPKAEAKYFDTPFGRFGMLVCFDLLFYNPAVTLINRHHVTDILFPTAWRDALPLLSAIGYHSSFARGLGVNLLGSNIHLPLFRFQGSGVYTPKGMAKFYYNNFWISPGKLVVSDIDVIKNSTNQNTDIVHELQRKDETPIWYQHESKLNKGEEFYSYVFHDRFTFRALNDSEGDIKVCNGAVCCHLKYEMEKEAKHELFALGAFDGLHTHEGQYYLQICTLLRCSDSQHRSSCGAKTFASFTKFKSLHLEGQFQTQYVYPQVVLSTNGQLELAKADSWEFVSSPTGNKIISSTGLQSAVLSATLFGRDYSRDGNTTRLVRDRKNNKGETNVLTLLYLPRFLLFIGSGFAIGFILTLI